MRKLALLSTLAFATTLSAQNSLTTLFASNNGGAAGGGNYFNLTVGPTDLTITALECNFPNAGTAGLLNVWLLPGASYVGNQTAGVVGWGGVPAAFGAAISAGTDVPTFVCLDSPITLMANQSYAVALEAVAPLQFNYTNGDGIAGVPGSGTNQSYSNPDLLLEAGSANNVAFSSFVFDPRVANVTIHYVLGPSAAPCALKEQYGSGCYDNPITYYEDFPASTFDMAGVPGQMINGFQLIPNGAGGYVVSPPSGMWFGDDGSGTANMEGAVPGAPPVSASILNLDDATVSVDLAAANFVHLMNVPGGNGGIETNLTIDSNGNLSIDPGLGSDFTPSSQEFVDGPQRFSPLWTDMSPNVQGGVHWDIDPITTNGYVTFHNVPDFGAPAGAPGNTFQVAIMPGGILEFRYENIVQGIGAIVGLTVGGRVADPGTQDFFDPLVGLNIVDLGAWLSAPTLDANSRPVENTGPFELIVDNMDPSVSFGAILASFVQDVPGTDLGFLGAPGCNAHIDPFANNSLGLFFPAGSAQHTQTMFAVIPPAASGLEFFLQAGLLQPGVNALNVVVTNGVRLRFGQ